MHFLNHKLPTYADKCDCSTLIVRQTAEGCLSAVVAEGGREGKERGFQKGEFRVMLFF